MMSLVPTPPKRAGNQHRSPLEHKSQAAMLGNSRSRAAEFYFNLSCLVRAAWGGRYEKVPFFLRHIWCALAR